MFKGKKVIIFDMDGTLIDSVGVWNKVDMELIKELGGLDELNELDIQQQRDKKLREYSKLENPYINYCHFLSLKYGNMHFHKCFPCPNNPYQLNPSNNSHPSTVVT